MLLMAVLCELLSEGVETPPCAHRPPPSAQPHLHKIVNSSMELAQTAKEPYNYFLLLRALFRSIGGGSHDLLYQEFLPLLPNLLQGECSVLTGICLTDCWAHALCLVQLMGGGWVLGSPPILENNFY